MYLLDTDTLTHLHAGRTSVREQLVRTSDPDVGITIVTQIEVLRGRHDFLLKAATGEDLLRAQLLLRTTETLLAQLLIVPFDVRAAETFDRLRQTKGLTKIGRADLLIASIALANQATLVTRNRRHFRQAAGLQVVNWVDWPTSD